MHLGTHFPFFIGQGSAPNPDKIFCNKQNYLNTISEPGNITTSDHIPITFKISTRPFYTKNTETYKMNKANWELFQQTPDANITIKDLNNCTKQQLEQETNNWLDTVKKKKM